MDPYCCKCSYCRAMNSNSYPRFQISILVEPVMVHLPHEAANSECVFLTKPCDFWSCSFSWPISRYLGGQGQLDTTCHWRRCRPLTPPGLPPFPPLCLRPSSSTTWGHSSWGFNQPPPSVSTKPDGWPSAGSIDEVRKATISGKQKIPNLPAFPSGFGHHLPSTRKRGSLLLTSQRVRKGCPWAKHQESILGVQKTWTFLTNGGAPTYSLPSGNLAPWKMIHFQIICRQEIVIFHFANC